MNRIPYSFPWALCLAYLGAGCATGPDLAHPPASSPASLVAPEAQTATVTTALTADPPLPGEDTTGWPGLQSAPTGGGHNHHEEHGGAHEDGGPKAVETPAAAGCPHHPGVSLDPAGRCPRCGTKPVAP